MRGETPCSHSLSTTCEPMKPDPPVTRTLIYLLRSVVIEGHAPVVLGDPVGVGQVHHVPHDPVARLLVDLAGGLLDGREDDVLVEAGDHAVRELQTTRVLRVEHRARNVVLPGNDVR